MIDTATVSPDTEPLSSLSLVLYVGPAVSLLQSQPTYPLLLHTPHHEGNCLVKDTHCGTNHIFISSHNDPSLIQCKALHTKYVLRVLLSSSCSISAAVDYEQVNQTPTAISKTMSGIIRLCNARCLTPHFLRH